jgi:hypothetical protein
MFFKNENQFLLPDFFEYLHKIEPEKAEKEITNIFLLYYKNMDLRNPKTFTYF